MVRADSALHEPFSWWRGKRVKSNQPSSYSPLPGSLANTPNRRHSQGCQSVFSLANDATFHCTCRSPLVGDQSLGFRHGDPAAFNHASIRAILLSENSQRGRSQRLRAQWAMAMAVLVPVVKYAATHSTSTRSWPSDLIPLAAVHCIRQSNLGIVEAIGEIIGSYSHFLLRSRHVAAQIIPDSGARRRRVIAAAISQFTGSFLLSLCCTIGSFITWRAFQGTSFSTGAVAGGCGRFGTQQQQQLNHFWQ